jgi:glycosyltransferase involved in cell wall biosynthesis
VTPAPLVTICIFTWNREAYLKLAIQAALAQTFTDFEILVMDNASEDGTAAMVRSFTDPRIRFHRNPYNRGAPGNYHLALKQARGRYILLSHDDDVMGPDLVARQVEAFRQHPALVAVTTNVSIIDEHGNPVLARRNGETADEIFPRGVYIHAWNTRHLWLPFPTLMIRRPLVRRLCRPIVWYSVSCLADIFAMVRLNRVGAVAYLADPLLAYRLHSQQAQFRYDQIVPPSALHTQIAVLLNKRPEFRKYVPMAMLLLLKYRFQLALLRSREPLDGLRRLRREIGAVVRKHALRVHRVMRKIRQDRRDPETAALAREYAASPWGPQISVATLLLGAGEPDPAAWDMTTDSPFHRWLLALRSGSSLCAGLPARGIRRVAIMGSMFNADLLAMDAARSGLTVVCFLDSNKLRCKKTLNRIPILPPQWLEEHRGEVDAAIISSENGMGEGILRMLISFLPAGSSLPVFSWKTLANQERGG